MYAIVSRLLQFSELGGAGWCDWVEAGLICIFIDPWIVNEARVYSYIKAILRHDKKNNKKKHLHVILMIKDEF